MNDCGCLWCVEFSFFYICFLSVSMITLLAGLIYINGRRYIFVFQGIYIYILIISCFMLFHNAFGRQPVSTKHVSYFGEYFGFREVEPGLSDIQQWT